MTELSGWVGIKNADDAIIEVRNLGDVAIGVKDNVVQIADRPDATYEWDYDAGEWVQPAITSAQIAAEVERRIAMPLTVTDLSVGTIQINMDAPSQRNIQGLSSVGILGTVQSSSTTVVFRDYANTEHDLTPADLVAMGLQVAARIQAVYAKSWTLKAMTPIPQDYTDDQYW